MARSPMTIACWLFPGKRNYRPRYVNVLYRQVQKHLSMAHRFVCVYDDRTYRADQFDDGIELMPIPSVARPLLSIGSLGGAMHPACFARLWHFSDEAAEAFPGRVFMFDVDSIPIGDLAPLVRYRPTAKFISLLRPPSSNGRSKPYITGGSWILKSGSFPEVWDDFIADPLKARADALEWFLNGHPQRVIGWPGGSDQAYLSYRFIPQMKERGPVTHWPDDCGILLWDHFRKQQGEVDGRLLHFNGHKKPWDLNWRITRELYAAHMEYRVINKPLRYGGRRYEVGDPFIGDPKHARALCIMRRLEVAG